MFSVEENKTSIVTDPYGPDIGYVLPRVASDIVLVSHGHLDHNHVSAVGGNPRVIDSIGKTYVGSFGVEGIPSYHDPARGKMRGPNAIYSWEMQGVRFAHMGDFGQRRLTEEQEALLKGVDVLMMPVGGRVTVDGATAARITRVIKPRVVIPMHYATNRVLMELDPVEAFTSRIFKIRRVGHSVEITPDDLPAQTEVWIMKLGQ